MKRPGRILLLVASSLIPASAIAVCGESEAWVSDPAGTVERARGCVAGNVEACRGISWFAGAGPVDLREIPEELALRVEEVLDRLCAAGDRVACSERAQILARLGRTGEALKILQAACKDDWTDCLRAAAMEAKGGRKEEAERLFRRVCDQARDADAGESCGCAAGLIEGSRRGDARELFARGCARGDDVSCAGERRLAGRKVARGSWEGLYRSGSGTLWLADEGQGRVSMRMDTRWANGHSCRYSGRGSVVGEEVHLDRGQAGAGACGPVLRRRAAEVSVEDPGDACRPVSCGVRGIFEGHFKREWP